MTAALIAPAIALTALVGVLLVRHRYPRPRPNSFGAVIIDLDVESAAREALLRLGALLAGEAAVLAAAVTLLERLTAR